MWCCLSGHDERFDRGRWVMEVTASIVVKVSEGRARIAEGRCNFCMLTAGFVLVLFCYRLVIVCMWLFKDYRGLCPMRGVISGKPATLATDRRHFQRVDILPDDRIVHTRSLYGGGGRSKAIQGKVGHGAESVGRSESPDSGPCSWKIMQDASPENTLRWRGAARVSARRAITRPPLRTT